MPICPFCQSEVAELLTNKRLSRKQKLVYEAVFASGNDGISHEKILGEIYPGKSPITIRSCIYNINKIISPMKIISRGKCYYLQ